MKFLIVLFAAAGLLAQTPEERVGPLPGGGFLLNSGWTLKPAGQQLPVGTFPMSEAVSENGKYLLVLNGGYDTPQIGAIDIATKRQVGSVRLPDAWLGLAIAPHSNRVYVGGGSTGMVYELSLDPATGALARTRSFPAVPDLANKGESFIGDVALSASGHLLYAADLYGNSIVVIDLRSGKLLGRWKAGRRPYRILVAPGGGQIFVSSWADGSVYEYDTANGAELARIRVGAHPTDMLWLTEPSPAEGTSGSAYSARLFVAASNTNNVYSFGVAKGNRLTMIEPIGIATTPMHPLGMTPSALAISPDHERLYVACSDANAIAVVDISGAQSRVLGFIPTGSYPTAIQVLPDKEIAISSGKGLGSHAKAIVRNGSVAFLPSPDDNRLADFTQTVLHNSPYRDETIYGPPANPQEAFLSRSEGHPSPIQHVIYIVKGSSAYDQVLGDLGKGNGEPSRAKFGESITPNLHKLAREFIDYDNFYENGDVEADGQNWAAAAIAPDYTEKLWPSVYAGRSKVSDFEGGEPANLPPAGYIWDNAIQAGIPLRDYGEWVTNLPLAAGTRQVERANDAALAPYVDMDFRGFDPAYSDVDRAREFVREWKRFSVANNAPRMIVMRLANDGASGALPPAAYAAQNDYAVGLIVDAVSHSSLWPSTAIFIMESAASWSDHVDPHRAPAWAISPYTHRGIVDSAMYNQMSMLRTMELILGLRPMTHFDGGARPMFGSFSRQADPRPYAAIQPQVSLTQKNAGNR